MLIDKILYGRDVVLVSPFAILFAAVSSGYTIKDFPPKFLEYFKTPLGQFVIYFVVIYVTYINDTTIPLKDMILEAIAYVLIIQALKFILHRFFTD